MNLRGVGSEVKRHRGALVELRLNLEAAAKLLGYHVTNAEAEPVSLSIHVSVRFVRGLEKGLEEVFDVRLVHSDTLVCHFYRDLVLLVLNVQLTTH